MPENFTHVQAGQVIEETAPTRNAILDAARAHKQSRSIGGIPVGEEDWRNLIRIKNTTASTVDRFGVLGLNGALITPDDNEDEFVSRILMKGTTPALTDHIGKYAICREPIKAGEIGRAWIFGDCPAKVYINDTAHTYADIIDGDTTQLQSAPTGTAKITYMPASASSGGASKCDVRLGVEPRRLVLDLDEDIAAGASGVGTIQKHTSSGYVDTTLTGVVLYNHRPATGTLASGTRVEAALEVESGLLVITEAYACPV